MSIWLPTNLDRGDTYAFGEGSGVAFVSLHDGESNRVFVSTESGAEWSEVHGLPEGCCVIALAAAAAGIYAGTTEHGVIFSEGKGWTPVGDESIAGNEVVSLALYDSVLYAATRVNGIYRLEGERWSFFNEGLPTHRVGVISLAATEAGLLASETTNLFRRLESGWCGLNPCLPAGRIPLGLRSHAGSVVYGWGAHGVYRSDDGGASWMSLADDFWQRRFVRALVANHSGLYACTQGEEASDVFRSIDGGASWEAFGDGLPRPAWTHALGLAGNVLLTGAGSHGVWRRALKCEPRIQPAEPFVLHQNEPNPFYGNTRIRFTMSGPCEASLELLGLRDQVVKVLWAGTAEAGTHEIVLEDDSLAPGIYTYRLHSAGFAQSRRLVLLR